MKWKAEIASLGCAKFWPRAELSSQVVPPFRRNPHVFESGLEDEAVWPHAFEVAMTYDYRTIMGLIRAADFEALEELAGCWDEFPCGMDDFIGRHWITNAIDCGSVEVVSWMLSHGASVPIATDDGYTVLHSVIERDEDDRYRMMRVLIDAGADVNEIGIHGYAPAHLAAVRNDVEALEVLHEKGADFSLRTTVDDYATPLEEARSLRRRHAAEAIAYLQALEDERGRTAGASGGDKPAN